MAIAYGAAGTADANSTRTIAPGFVGSTTDFLVSVFAQKYADRTVPTPSGWTPLGAASGGAGTNGTVDEGQVKLWAFGKEKDGSEGSTLSVTDSGGTASCFGGRIFSFTKGAGEIWSVVGSAIAADNTPGTGLIWTYDIDPGFIVGDIAVTLWVSNSDAYTHTHSLSVPGVSALTTASRGNVAVTAGAHLRYGLVTHTIDTGTSSGVATYTNTASGSATNAPAGASILIRLRATAAGGSSIAAISSGYAVRGVMR